MKSLPLLPPVSLSLNDTPKQTRIRYDADDQNEKRTQMGKSEKRKNNKMK